MVFGIVQGLTEWLPISSTAHLRIVPALLGWDDPGAAFTAVIQLGTTAAVILYFRADLVAAFRAWLVSLMRRRVETVEARMGWAIFLGTLPIIAAGLLLREPIETTFRSVRLIAFALIAFSFVMLAVERFARRQRGPEQVTIKDGLWVGLWQCFALVPGVSRSGCTISGAMIAGFDRVTAARLSFLMSFPSILGAGLYELYKERHEILGQSLQPTLVATVVSFLVGYATIAGLIRYLQRHGFLVFILYRVALGAVLLAMVHQGMIEDAPSPPAQHPATGGR